MSKPRFQMTYGAVAMFADRFRFDPFMSMGRFHLGITADVNDRGNEQSPVIIDLPLKDRAAYERAAAAFNAIMDEHDEREAAKNERRRARRASSPSPIPSPCRSLTNAACFPTINTNRHHQAHPLRTGRRDAPSGPIRP